MPLQTFKRGGKTVYTFNVTNKTVTDPQTGKTHTVYEYDEAEGDNDGHAQQVAESNAALKLAALGNMNYKELDDYIDANVTSIATAKVFMKRLAKAVLAMLKERQ